ncbi:MAG TPA: hypothetical protein VG076_03595 [Acidimicrobiales bacterium]|jgi:hypothetical protein|nr:hypothetical protein [Acidimicrobiales bacterium]
MSLLESRVRKAVVAVGIAGVTLIAPFSALAQTPAHASEKVSIPAAQVPKFSAGSALKQSVRSN